MTNVKRKHHDITDQGALDPNPVIITEQAQDKHPTSPLHRLSNEYNLNHSPSCQPPSSHKGESLNHTHLKSQTNDKYPLQFRLGRPLRSLKPQPQSRTRRSLFRTEWCFTVTMGPSHLKAVPQTTSAHSQDRLIGSCRNALKGYLLRLKT
ncbi:hypothetical protein K432DRAFT_385667 [Lepidopterella palustris CBS 459.81]|uniref:Uncharacterized protein n=1 Tax=Lepidopterella palustris CBS 459.81 TaxID=1314670 RepID=A0A8E2E2F3_9PEZI|nr:hypothetical protein K432DRAFT_385667 [Lepidopterella palustris CBS 459.81]